METEEYKMQTLHVKTNAQIMTRILNFINSLVRDGAEIEIIDDKVYNYEKRMIDQALKDVQAGRTYSFDEVGKKLINVN